MSVAVGTSNVLRKLGADMRWFLQQNGVEAESVRIIIAVKTTADEKAIEHAFKAQFDASEMEIDDGQTGVVMNPSEVVPRAIKVFGVKFSLVRVVGGSK
jgi:hypothetical protein